MVAAGQVVHHQYPGAHWTDHPKLYEKHKQEYVDKRASVFNGTHAMEIFFMAILKDYDMMATKFVDVTGKLTHAEKRELLIARMRTCAWGPHAKPSEKKKE